MYQLLLFLISILYFLFYYTQILFLLSNQFFRPINNLAHYSLYMGLLLYHLLIKHNENHLESLLLIHIFLLLNSMFHVNIVYFYYLYPFFFKYKTFIYKGILISKICVLLKYKIFMKYGI